MKYNHTNRISLSRNEYAFRTWPLYDWSVKVSYTFYAVEISRKPPPLSPDTQTQRISYKNEYLVLNFQSNLGAYEHNLLAYERDIRGCKFVHPGANLHPLMSRSYANKLCSYVPRFD